MLVKISFVVSFYLLLGLHVYAYLMYISPLMKRKIGTGLALTWGVTGLTLCYNCCYNHLMAMIIKPGGPSDLHRISLLQQQLKTQNKPTTSTIVEDTQRDELFKNLSTQVKNIMRFRSRTIGDLE